MCGIAGLVDYSRSTDLKSLAHTLPSSLRHRGPDATGASVHENTLLCHARLSIIDLAGGSQPMSTNDGQIHLTYNGEIYNYKELRQDLEKLGFSFATSSDTEVVLKSYVAWGRFCVERFEGMFAFAILDLERRELMLARDHFGIKPLLYRLTSHNFAFASEFAALKTLPDWKNEIDLNAIDLFLRYQYIPAPHTAFRNVRKLPAGHRMIVGMNTPRIHIERYWSPNFTSKKKRSKAALLDELDACLKDSVRRHLVSDVPFGAFLSGGIDSSLVVSYMTELLDKPVETFSIGFDDSQYSEVTYARQVADKYKTNHHEEILNVDAFQALPEIVRHHGEPFGDQSSIATWALSRLARRHVPMALSGDGGDELFAGYSTYGSWLHTHTLPDSSYRTRALTVARRIRNLVAQKNRRFTTNKNQDLDRWQSIIGRFLAADDRCNLWRSELRFVSDFPSRPFDDAWSDTQKLTRVNQAQWMDLQTFLPEDILNKVDIASMSVGLEVRPPIIDKRVMEFAASIPETDLYQQNDEFCGKLPLKLLVEKKLGKDFAFRKKQGFEIPLEKWLRGSETRKQELKGVLTDESAGLSEWFCPKAMCKVVDHGSAFNLWLLVVLREWKAQNV